MISIEDKLSKRFRSGGCGNLSPEETAPPPYWKPEAGFVSSLRWFVQARHHACTVCELRFSRTEFHPPMRPRNIIDIRTHESFARGHLPYSTSIPADELQERLLEMPPPVEDPLTLLGESEDHISAAQQLLVEKGWELSAVFSEVDVRDDLISTDPSVQCWRPNDFLECVIEELKDRLPAVGVAIDYGCGSGRDVVYLAQRLKGWRVIGVDNHSNALARAERLARRYGVDVEFICQDLRKDPNLNTTADLVHGCRFLSRPLLVYCKHEVLKDDGLFVWSTFADGVENPAPPYRTSRRLVQGELKRLFPDEELEEIHYSRGTLTTRQKPVPAEFFAGRKKPARTEGNPAITNALETERHERA
ncbi:hypothetical protein NDN08_008295 [Rhodosorus marinus]|uniref:Rhodanese domain-containing protein n=1 Tax=Rhodosorus marinus TaxID=101924 RepID=A0AAV8V4M5_9RHOD|nr:hypothetical protein NDN08_008295 [Rhodosorus marinus]